MHCWGQDGPDLDSYSNYDYSDSDSDGSDGSDSVFFLHYYSDSDYLDFDSDGSDGWCRFNHCWGQDDGQPICAGWGDNFSGWSLMIIYV